MTATADTIAGMHWWNTLPPQDRAAMIQELAFDPRNTGSAAEAWARFKDCRDKLTHLVGLCEEHPEELGPLSTGERVAVALVLDQPDWLKETGFTSKAAATAYIDASLRIAAAHLIAKRARAPL